MSSAGVAYSITKACSTGNLAECGCDDKIRSKDTKNKFEWGGMCNYLTVQVYKCNSINYMYFAHNLTPCPGCSDDIRFGASFSKDFVDSSEDGASAQSLMNLHNNEAGRRTLRSNMELICKCHGVSGSCTIRVCWRKMKTFRAIGDALGKKFDAATQVRLMETKSMVKGRLKPIRKDAKRPSKKDLVFFDDSPDYCQSNET